jgi:adenylate cyclase, class 2
MVSGRKETEVKILDIDRIAVEEKLASLGAKVIFDDDITAFYYDFPDSSIRGRGGTLRLRREGKKSVLTLKKDFASTEAKIREEHETEVSDFNEVQYILETIGLQAWIGMKKHRKTYEFNGVRFEIDSYQDAFRHIPAFLEIEGQDVESVYAHAELLGFSRGDCKPWDILQVAAFYASEGGDR